MRRLAAIACLLCLVAGCSEDDEPSARTPVAPTEAPPAPTRASLHNIDIATLPRLPRSQAAGLPARIPPIDADVPNLFDDLPGRAVVVVNPSITVLNMGVANWSELELMVYGVDRRWRRLNLGDLGLDEGLIVQDTYGAGSLSSDGRWWTGGTSAGSVLLNMRTGAVRLMSLDSGDWIPGRDAILTNGAETTIPGLVTTRVPYDYFTVGYEPDGTPLSLERGRSGEALLVEWRGGTRQARTAVAGIDPPREPLGERRRNGRYSYSQLSRVAATTGMVAQTQLRGRSRGRGGGRERVAIVAADSTTGAKVGELVWQWKDFPLTYDDWWLNEQTMLIATRPYFVAWRPRTGEVFRVTDAHAVSDSYWSLTVASQAALPRVSS